ncbi:MAG TPA: YqzE family protein [Bacillota bacterium]
MSRNEYIQFITKQFVTYINMSTTEKQKKREEKKKRNDLLFHRWLGLVPFSVKLFFQNDE